MKAIITMWRLFKCAWIGIMAGCGIVNSGAPYPVTVALDVAKIDFRIRTADMRHLYADLSSTGYATIKFGSTSAPALTLTAGSQYPIQAEDVFLTFLAQPGKKLELLHSSNPIGGGGNIVANTPTPGTYFYKALRVSASPAFEILSAANNDTGAIIRRVRVALVSTTLGAFVQASLFTGGTAGIDEIIGFADVVPASGYYYSEKFLTDWVVPAGEAITVWNPSLSANMFINMQYDKLAR